MKKARILLALGVWVAILPYLGFPPTWKAILFSISGLGIIFIAYLIYREHKINFKLQKKNFDNFSENMDFNEVEEKINLGENNVF